jgi:hypothetical protein
MFWKNGINVRLIGFKSKYHLDTEITEEEDFVWRFTGIYGEPKMDEKEKNMASAMYSKTPKQKTLAICRGFQ